MISVIFLIFQTQVYLKLNHDRFLERIFQLTAHQSFYDSTLQNFRYWVCRYTNHQMYVTVKHTAISALHLNPPFVNEMQQFCVEKRNIRKYGATQCIQKRRIP
jgi:hypothetical protein